MCNKCNGPKHLPHPGMWLASLSTQTVDVRVEMAAQIKGLFAPYGWTGSKPEKWGTLADPVNDYSHMLPWTVAAIVEDEVVGSASLVRRDNAEMDCGPWLAGLVVKPEFKQLGVASLLIEEVVRQARHLFVHKHPDVLEGNLYLDTERTLNNFDSVDMYARRGWNYISNEHAARNEGIVMVRDLRKL